MFKYDPCSKGVEEDLRKDETERKKKKKSKGKFNTERKGEGKISNSISSSFSNTNGARRAPPVSLWFEET